MTSKKIKVFFLKNFKTIIFFNTEMMPDWIDLGHPMI
jgi:hypothetical protein